MKDVPNRKPGHDRQGREYKGTLAERADAAMSMIGKMCAEGRPPKMAVPAGDCVHWTPCGDEDIYIVDLLHDLLTQIEVLQIAADYSDCGTVFTPHDDDVAVDKFAVAMKKKMAVSRAKGRSGWQSQVACPTGSLQKMLIAHLEKGDPVDVGNFAMMLFNRGERTEAAKPVPAYVCAACGLAAMGSSVKPMPHESKLYRALEYVIRDLEVRADLKLDEADRGIVEIGNGAYLQAKDALRQADPKIAREALVSLVNDDPEADGTDFAHPAWWRGNDAGVEGVVDALNRAMDRGAEDGGKFGNAKLQALRDRIMEGRGRAESDS